MSARPTTRIVQPGHHRKRLSLRYITLQYNAMRCNYRRRLRPCWSCMGRIALRCPRAAPPSPVCTKPSCYARSQTYLARAASRYIARRRAEPSPRARPAMAPSTGCYRCTPRFCCYRRHCRLLDALPFDASEKEPGGLLPPDPELETIPTAPGCMALPSSLDHPSMLSCSGSVPSA